MPCSPGRPESPAAWNLRPWRAPSGIEGIFEDDGLAAVRPRGDDVDAHPDDLFEPAQVQLGVLRQVVVALDAQGRGVPARQLLVHRLDVGIVLAGEAGRARRAAGGL